MEILSVNLIKSSKTNKTIVLSEKMQLLSTGSTVKINCNGAQQNIKQKFE